MTPFKPVRLWEERAVKTLCQSYLRHSVEKEKKPSELGALQIKHSCC